MGRPKAGVTNEMRFWGYVTKSDGCWIWTGYINETGYGRTYWNDRNCLAHRISFEMNVGPIPDGLMVLHSCDNPPCVNPAHLHLGTRADNNREMNERGRRVQGRTYSGARNPMARLTEDEAALIRRLKPRGRAARAMAVELGVDEATVRRVVTGKTYRSAA